jgi:hypothetical protein
MNDDPGQLLLVVTPGSDPGGRTFDSCPRNCSKARRGVFPMLFFSPPYQGGVGGGSSPESPAPDLSLPTSIARPTEAIRPDEGPVLKTGGGPRRLWVRVPRLPLRSARTSRGPGTPTAERPGLNPGACGFDSHPGYGWSPIECRRPGRQTGKAACLRSRCLRVRLPPGPLSHSLVCGLAWYANRQSGGAQTSVRVGSTPTRATRSFTRRLGIGEPKWL